MHGAVLCEQYTNDTAWDCNLAPSSIPLWCFATSVQIAAKSDHPAATDVWGQTSEGSGRSIVVDATHARQLVSGSTAVDPSRLW